MLHTQLKISSEKFPSSADVHYFAYQHFSVCRILHISTNCPNVLQTIDKCTHGTDCCYATSRDGVRCVCEILMSVRPRTPDRSYCDSAVGIATGYVLDGRGVGVLVPVGARFLSSRRRPGWFWGPPSLLPNGYRGLFLRGVKWPGREADHSPPRVPRSRIIGSIHPLSSYVFMAHCLISYAQGQIYLYTRQVGEGATL
jgi:hypothetical protein